MITITSARLLLPLFLLLAIANPFRVTLNSKNPDLTMFFNVTAGKNTFSVVSSGEENHDIIVTIEYTHPRVTGSEPLLNKTTNDIDFTHDYP
jgi:hypothetical protein